MPGSSMASFSVEYIFRLIDQFTPGAGKLGAAAKQMAGSVQQAGNAANQMAGAAGKIGAAMNQTAAAAAAAQRGLAGYANAAQNAAFRAAAAQRVMARDQAWMAKGYTRGADGNWVAPAKGGGGGGGLGGFMGDARMFGIAAFASYFTGIGRKMYETNVEFMREYNNARAVMAKSDEADLERMKQNAIDLSKTVGFTATDLMKAYGALGAAGYEARDAIDLMPVVSKMAKAGRDDIDKTAETLIGIRNQFGLKNGDTGHVANVLAETARQTLAQLPDLREAFKMAGPFAEVAGVDLETTSALIGVLAQKGIKGSLAGTGLRRLETGFLKDDKKSRKFLKDHGIDPKTVYDAKGRMKDFVGTLEALEKKGVKAADVMKVFGDRAGPVLAALLEVGSKEVRRLVGDLKDSAGAADKMFEEQMRGLPGALDRFNSAMEAARLEVGQSGVMDTWGFLVNRVTDVINLFSALPQPVQWAVGALAGVAGAVAAAAMPLAMLNFALGGALAGLFTLSSLAIGGGIIISLMATGWLYENWDRLGQLFSGQQKVDVLFPEAPAWLQWLMQHTADMGIRGQQSVENAKSQVNSLKNWLGLGSDEAAGAVGNPRSWVRGGRRNDPDNAWFYQGRKDSQDSRMGPAPPPAAAIPQSMSVTTQVNPIQINPASINVNVTGTVNGPVQGTGTGQITAQPGRGTSTVEAGGAAPAASGAQ